MMPSFVRGAQQRNHAPGASIYFNHCLSQVLYFAF